MWGRVSALGIVLLAALSGPVSGGGCGGQSESQTLEAEEVVQVNTSSNFKKLAICPPVGRELVCGKNGQTYPDLCAAGGPAQVAHLGGCADFLCNGAVCPEGSSCRSFRGNGGPLDSCVAN